MLRVSIGSYNEGRDSFCLKFFTEIIQLNTMLTHFGEVSLGKLMPVTFGKYFLVYIISSYALTLLLSIWSCI